MSRFFIVIYQIYIQQNILTVQELNLSVADVNFGIHAQAKIIQTIKILR